MMKNKRMIRILSLLMAAILSMSILSVTAYAYGGSPDEHEDEEYSEPLTPEGNMTLVDDIEDENGTKQFITVVTKNGNYFYIIIDRADEGENTVHFLNQVDESDLLALMEGEQPSEAAPIVCTCIDKCAAGAVDTSCPICAKNMSECAGKEVKPIEPEEEPEEPEPVEEKSSNKNLLLVVLILAIGGGAAAYFLILKPKKDKKAPSDLDDFDLEDEEYLGDDETEDTE